MLTKKQNPMLKWLERIIRFIIIVAGLMTLVHGIAYTKADKVNKENWDNSPQNVSGLINYKPFMRWELNSMGWSQEYIELKGTRPTLRMQEMLIKYGYGGTLNTWDDIGFKHGIKTEVLICIAKAETTLGKYTKSKNNLGNVGNNDRGDTVDFDSRENAVEWMGITLNNSYQNEKQELWQLSNYGMKGKGYIYASSWDSRHKNVKNCLGNIYGHPVTDAFEFRR